MLLALFVAVEEDWLNVALLLGRTAPHKNWAGGSKVHQEMVGKSKQVKS